jgi:hypothetical protein
MVGRVDVRPAVLPGAELLNTCHASGMLLLAVHLGCVVHCPLPARTVPPPGMVTLYLCMVTLYP